MVLARNRILKQAYHLYFNAHPRPNTHVQASGGVSLGTGKKTAKQVHKEQRCSQNSPTLLILDGITAKNILYRTGFRNTIAGNVLMTTKYKKK